MAGIAVRGEDRFHAFDVIDWVGGVGTEPNETEEDEKGDLRLKTHRVAPLE